MQPLVRQRRSATMFTLKRLYHLDHTMIACGIAKLLLPIKCDSFHHSIPKALIESTGAQITHFNAQGAFVVVHLSRLVFRVRQQKGTNTLPLRIGKDCHRVDKILIAACFSHKGKRQHPSHKTDKSACAIYAS